MSSAAAHPRGVHDQAQEPAPSARGPCPATPRALAVVEEGLTGGQSEAAAKAHSRHAPVLLDARASTSTVIMLQRLSTMHGRPDAKHSSAEQRRAAQRRAVVGAGGEVGRGTGAGTVSPAATAATAQHKVGAAVRERHCKRHGGTTQLQSEEHPSCPRVPNSCRPRRTRHRGGTGAQRTSIHPARTRRAWQSWQALEVDATRSTVPEQQTQHLPAMSSQSAPQRCMSVSKTTV